jgi:hypothetical protein
MSIQAPEDWDEPGVREVLIDTRQALASLTEGGGAPLQARVQPWMMACFGAEIAADRVERGDRLLEEVLELLQSGGYDPARVVALRDYVWGRPPGEPAQEVGGVMITLAAYCLAYGLDMHEAGETELARIWTKVEAIRAKQAAKPTGSALPIPSPHTPEDAGTGELLPCPHCGGSAAHRPNGKDYAEAGCKACGASMQMGLINRDWHRTKHALVWAWNRRPPLLPDREGVARIAERYLRQRPIGTDIPKMAEKLAASILSLLGGVHAE